MHMLGREYVRDICKFGSILLQAYNFCSKSGGSNGKETACNAGDLGSMPGLDDPW